MGGFELPGALYLAEETVQAGSSRKGVEEGRLLKKDYLLLSLLYLLIV